MIRVQSVGAPAAPGVPATALCEPAGRWLALGVPAVIAILSRLYSSALILLADGPVRSSIPTPFTWWDAGWYLEIAEHGYHPTNFAVGVGTRYDFAFFPLWPALIRAASVVPGSDRTVSVLLANLLFVLAAVLLWRVLADRLGTSAATGAIALLAFSPPSFVFSMAYSEPLFLVVAGSCFLASTSAGRRALTTALAMFARIDGAAIVAAAAIVAVWRHGPPRRAAVAAIVAGCAAFAVWWLFIALLVHDPLGFLRASPSWYRTAGWQQYLTAISHPSVRNVARLGFAALVLLGSMLVVRRDVELGVYSLGVLAISLLPGGVIYSLPRYAVVAFPAFAGLSGVLGRRGTLALVVALALAQGLFVKWAFAMPGAQPP